MASNSATKLRDIQWDDVDAAAKVIFEAFQHLNHSVGLDVEVDFPSRDASMDAVEQRMKDESSSGVVAVNSTGLVVGVGFVRHGGDVHYLCLISVLPNMKGKGIAKDITQNLMDKARVKNATSIRLVQAASNVSSFSLYVKLGFHPVEFWSHFMGHPEKGVVAAESIGIRRLDYATRRMRPSDLDACSDLFTRVLGYDRSQMIEQRRIDFQVIVITKADTVVGFATGFTRSGYVVAEDEDAAIALYVNAPLEVDDKPPNIQSELKKLRFNVYFLGFRYPKLLKWAFDSGLRLIRHGTVMASGTYKSGKVSGVYCGNME